MASRRALHYVFKVGNRTKTVQFYRNVLGMKILRHEEFEKGCEAACNGPYDGRWSKSMVGYGPEDTHFVIELTYNYGIGSYTMGNDFRGITIESSDVLKRVKESDYPSETSDSCLLVKSPDGHPFYVKGSSEGKTGEKSEKEEENLCEATCRKLNACCCGKNKSSSKQSSVFFDIRQASEFDPVTKVSLAVSDLPKSTDYWQNQCGMTVHTQDANSTLLGYSGDQFRLQLVKIEEPINRAKAFGRTAFACPRDQLPGIEKGMREAGHTILTPLISLDTPGKATVEVVIPADPDGHEICFVGDEAFRELSQVDPKADELIDEAIAKDKSDEWFAKKGRSKEAE